MAQHDRIVSDAELPALGSAQNKEILDQPTKPVRLGLDVGEMLSNGRLVHRSEVLAQDMAHPEDRGDRRPELMADHADEGVAERAAALGLRVSGGESFSRRGELGGHPLGSGTLALEGPGCGKEICFPSRSGPDPHDQDIKCVVVGLGRPRRVEQDGDRQAVDRGKHEEHLVDPSVRAQGRVDMGLEQDSRRRRQEDVEQLANERRRIAPGQLADCPAGGHDPEVRREAEHPARHGIPRRAHRRPFTGRQARAGGRARGARSGSPRLLRPGD